MKIITNNELHDALGFGNKKYNTVKYTREEKFSIRPKLKEIKKRMPSVRSTFFPDQLLLDIGVRSKNPALLNMHHYSVYFPLRIYKTADKFYAVATDKDDNGTYYMFDSWNDVQDNCEAILTSMVSISDIVQSRRVYTALSELKQKLRDC
jgi:hypothetical protein